MEKQKPTNPPASMQGVNPNPINKDKGTASQVTVFQFYYSLCLIESVNSFLSTVNPDDYPEI